MGQWECPWPQPGLGSTFQWIWPEHESFLIWSVSGLCVGVCCVSVSVSVCVCVWPTVSSGAGQLFWTVLPPRLRSKVKQEPFGFPKMVPGTEGQPQRSSWKWGHLVRMSSRTSWTGVWGTPTWMSSRGQSQERSGLGGNLQVTGWQELYCKNNKKKYNEYLRVFCFVYHFLVLSVGSPSYPPLKHRFIYCFNISVCFLVATVWLCLLTLIYFRPKYKLHKLLLG